MSGPESGRTKKGGRSATLDLISTLVCLNSLCLFPLELLLLPLKVLQFLL